jgi:hypothetical protein
MEHIPLTSFVWSCFEPCPPSFPDAVAPRSPLPPQPDLACLLPVEVVKEHINSAGSATLRVESFETRPPLTQEDENEELPFDTPVVPFHFASPEDPAPRQGFEWVGDEIVKVKVRPHLGASSAPPAVYLRYFATSRMTVVRCARLEVILMRGSQRAACFVWFGCV